MRYLLRRLAQAVLVLWAAFTLTFFLLYLVGDPMLVLASRRSSTPGSVDMEVVAALRQQYGFDRPVLVRYVDTLVHAVGGDLGTSFDSGRPVTTVVFGALPNTLILATSALVLAMILGSLVAVASVHTRMTWLRGVLSSLPPVGISLPPFFVGLLLLQLFSFTWPIFPALGSGGLRGLILPTITLALPVSALIAQVLAKSLRNTLNESYIQTAIAKGAGRSRVLFGHAARNAAIPALTIVGMAAGGLIGGSVIVETVFSRSGLGRITVDAVNAVDIPVVLGVVVLAAGIYVLINLIVDLIYPLIDPRLTRRGGTTKESAKGPVA